MPHMNHILVPVELHENAVPVVQWAALLAKATQGRLTVLHVNEALEPVKNRPIFWKGGTATPSIPIADLHDTYTQAAGQDLGQLAAQHCAGLSVETVLGEGRAPAVILEHCQQYPYDLIVMGTHGRPWYQRLLLGSTAETILRAATLPVLVVHNAEVGQRPPQLNQVLLPTDLSACSLAGIEWGVFLAQHGAEAVTLLHVVENPFIEVYEPDKTEVDVQRLMEEARQHPPRSAQPFWEHAQQTAEEKLTALRSHFQGTRARVELLTRDGLAADTLRVIAEEKQSDLIVMATHGRTGVRHLLLGSVTEKMVRTAPCPVLVVRGEG